MICSETSCPHRTKTPSGCALGRPGGGLDRGNRLDDFAPAGLTTLSLELGKALVDRGKNSYTASGFCMYPLLRPGDLLIVETKMAAQAEVGDIAVCRRENYLFGHRVIDKGVDGGKPCVVTRPDNTRHGNDGPTYDDNLLGIVSVIERKGKRVETSRLRLAKFQRRYWMLRMRLILSLDARRGRLIGTLSFFQRGTVYRQLVRLFLAVGRIRPSFVVRLPFGKRRSFDLFHPLPVDEFDVSSTTWRDRKVDCWSLALHLGDERTPAAWAVFVLRPPNCPYSGWWLDGLQTRIRYRGAGLEADLVRKAEEILTRGGFELQGSDDESKNPRRNTV